MFAVVHTDWMLGSPFIPNCAMKPLSTRKNRTPS